MIIGVPLEIKPGETRVALIPDSVKVWTEKGAKVLVETGAGKHAGHSDEAYKEAGADIAANRTEVFQQSDIVLQVQSFGANNVNSNDDLNHLKPGQVVAGMMDPLGCPENAKVMAEKKVSAFAMELVPRISRAQSMDVLSSMATLAGYKAVLIGASNMTRIMPLMMTAAGTLKPARAFVMGAGVAGLQACATAKRLGAVVEAYDVRPAAREQIVSVGAKPIEFPELETEAAEDKGGYAKAQGDDFIKRQQELMTEVLAEQDLVVTTAAIPGAKSPTLITEDMVKAMKPGTVIVDLAAERGGNCALTQLGETITAYGVTIIGPDNIATTMPNHASQMFSKNMEDLLGHILHDDNKVTLDFEDEIIHETVIAHDGDVTHKRMRELLGMAPLAQPEQPAATEDNNGGETS